MRAAGPSRTRPPLQLLTRGPHGAHSPRGARAPRTWTTTRGGESLSATAGPWPPTPRWTHPATRNRPGDAVSDSCYNRKERWGITDGNLRGAIRFEFACLQTQRKRVCMFSFCIPADIVSSVGAAAVGNLCKLNYAWVQKNQWPAYLNLLYPRGVVRLGQVSHGHRPPPVRRVIYNTLLPSHPLHPPPRQH